MVPLQRRSRGAEAPRVLGNLPPQHTKRPTNADQMVFHLKEWRKQPLIVHSLVVLLLGQRHLAQLVFHVDVAVLLATVPLVLVRVALGPFQMESIVSTPNVVDLPHPENGVVKRALSLPGSKV